MLGSLMELDLQKLRIDRRDRIRPPLAEKLGLQMAAAVGLHARFSDAAWQMNTAEEMDVRFHRNIDPHDLVIGAVALPHSPVFTRWPQRALPMLMVRGTFELGVHSVSVDDRAAVAIGSS
jgi:hypothetical protein